MNLNDLAAAPSAKDFNNLTPQQLQNIKKSLGHILGSPAEIQQGAQNPHHQVVLSPSSSLRSGSQTVANGGATSTVSWSVTGNGAVSVQTQINQK